MAFCIPVSIDRVGTTPDGSVVIQGRQICWGSDVPPPPITVPPPSTLPPTTGQPPATGTDTNARTGAKTEAQAKTQEDTCTENCPKCAARKLGSSFMRHYGAVTGGALTGYLYQHYICPWHQHLPASQSIEEWRFGDVEFDGLHPAECHLYEAKHGFDGFLVQRDWSASGGPELADWAKKAGVQQSVFDRMLNQGRKQHMQVSPYYGEVSLTWVFSHMITRLFVGRLFLTRITGWYHEMEVRPFGA